MMGLIACSEETYRRVKLSVKALGCPAGPDDCYLALRGLRTLAVRMKRHEKSGLTVARWLEDRPEVIRVMHPGLESHPQVGHTLYLRSNVFVFLGLLSFMRTYTAIQDPVPEIYPQAALTPCPASNGCIACGLHALILLAHCFIQKNWT